jgi:hypothetical protein
MQALKNRHQSLPFYAQILFFKSAAAVLLMYLWHLILYTFEITRNHEDFLAAGQV